VRAEMPAAAASRSRLSARSILAVRIVRNGDEDTRVEIAGSTSSMSRNPAGSAITDKPSAGPPTTKDGVLASDVITARRLLITTREMRAAMDHVVAQRPTEEHPSRWRPGAGLNYWLAIGRLSEAVDGLFSPLDLDNYAGRREELARQIDEGIVPVGVGFTCGREGRGRPMTGGPLELAIRSLALRIEGLPPAKADELTADEANRSRPVNYWVSPSSVAVYRKRLRDRLN
jgi:hypothetical protein